MIPKMLSVIQKICIFAFVILPVLHFGDANAVTSQSTQTTSPAPAAVEAQINLTPTILPAAQVPTITITTTTTTLASSNAPATTIEAAPETETSLQNSETSAAEEIDNDDDVAILTTMLPEILQQTTKLDDAMFTTSTSALNQGESETTASIVGNEVKTEIKNAEKDIPLQGIQLPVTENSQNAQNRMNEQEATKIPHIMEKAGKSETLEGLSAGETTTMTAMTSASPMTMTDGPASHNHVQVEGKLKNGLYRIKLAEIVTDEFGALPDEMNTAGKPLDNINDKKEEHQTSDKHYIAAGKVNIADLYPIKKEDFDPIIRDSNTKLLRERTVFQKPADEEEYRQNLLPNEVEIHEKQTQYGIFASDASKTQPRQLRTLEMTLMSRDGDTISDFTGKLLAEQDGIITEIEQKFRLNEFGATENSKTTTSPSKVTVSSGAHETVSITATTNAPTVTAKPASFINQHLFKTNGKGHDFIDRRVKKSFAFPMHRAASDVMSEPYVDFANTKFTGGGGGGIGAIANGSPAANAKTFTADSATNSGNAPPSGVAVAGAAHPEFSTTKFYNSKELYNEMIMHNRLKQLQNKSATATTTTSASASKQPHSNGFTATTTVLPGAASRFAALKNIKSLPVVSKDPFSSTSSSSSSPSSSFAEIALKRAKLIATTIASVVDATSSTTTSTTEPSAAPIALEIASAENGKPKKFQKELKRAKLLLKVVLPTTSSPTSSSSSTTRTTTTTTTITNASLAAVKTPITTSPMSSSIFQTPFNSLTARATTISSLGTFSSSAMSETKAADALSAIPVTTMTTAMSNTTPQLRMATNPTKAASKPIARPRILSSLQEKINSLECEIQNVPQDSHLWRGNETHELLLPIITPAHCGTTEEHSQRQEHQRDCSTTPVSVSWDGESEIQSGDILIVEINDATLLKDKSNTYSAHFTQVYQVTRSGHEHCDVTEGILLDITPLVVDGRKLVTLYDKDLTEGVNLLIVVSELWGSQCVRLKVTAKTDNCGENADCSGKGVCYSNAAMEEYECQCCSGFAGPHCEEIDACTPSPCTNNGICVDLSQGHDGNSYQCLCPYGYTGKNCQYESDPCNPAECMNGGTCIGNSTHFRCDCTPGYAGPLCQHSLNECESSPCVHGICVDQEDGFRCFCQPGFAGELCNFEYNECESNPCQNGGECIDHIGSFECRCTKGFTGNRCQIKVDFCANKPCPEGHRCIDHGNDFSCECPGGRNGPDCNQMARTQCNVNPCTHGGTCWSSGDSFYCACRPGYTGTMCEDEFVVETVVSSSEFIVDDVNAQNLNDKTFGSSVVLKSPIELHNAYFAAGVLAAAFFIVAVVVTICHCKVNQTYRKFSTRTTSFIPIIGFGRRPKPQSKLNKHWLSGKGLGSGNSLRSSASATSSRGHLSSNGTALHHSQQQTNVGQLHERPFQRHLAMNLENDMYYTVDFSENSQHSPLIQ